MIMTLSRVRLVVLIDVRCNNCLGDKKCLQSLLVYCLHLALFITVYEK